LALERNEQSKLMMRRFVWWVKLDFTAIAFKKSLANSYLNCNQSRTSSTLKLPRRYISPQIFQKSRIPCCFPVN